MALSPCHKHLPIPKDFPSQAIYEPWEALGGAGAGRILLQGPQPTLKHGAESQRNLGSLCPKMQ